MTGKTPYTLEELVPFDTFREIIKRVHDVTGLRTVVTDYRGVLYDGFEVEGEYDPCHDIRFSELGEMCAQSDAYAGLEAARLGRPIIYLCHLGAAEAVSPIIVSGHYYGSVLTGHSLLPPEEMASLPQFVKCSSCMTAKQKLLCEQLPSKLVPNTLSRLQAIANLLFLVTNYIAEIGYRSITQKKISEYETSLLRERNINADLERNIANAKMRNIQAQMHPHFLFNALNTINQTAILEGGVETPKLIQALSSIMRRTLAINDETSTLEDELSQIRNYLYIAQVSTGDRLKVVWDVDDSCLDAACPPFTIQPLVENSVVHGLDPKIEGGTISISIKKFRGMLQINICDTGCGMDLETLQSLQALKANGYTMPDSSTSSIGIRNSMQILNSVFGSSFDWLIDSSPQTGTQFYLHFPYRPYNFKT